MSLLVSSGRPLTQVETELGVKPSMLRGWRAAANGIAKPGADAPAGHAAAAAATASAMSGPNSWQELVKLLHEANSSFESTKLVHSHRVRIEVHDVVANQANIVEKFRQNHTVNL